MHMNGRGKWRWNILYSTLSQLCWFKGTLKRAHPFFCHVHRLTSWSQIQELYTVWVKWTVLTLCNPFPSLIDHSSSAVCPLVQHSSNMLCSQLAHNNYVTVTLTMHLVVYVDVYLRPHRWGPGSLSGLKWRHCSPASEWCWSVHLRIDALMWRDSLRPLVRNLPAVSQLIGVGGWRIVWFQVVISRFPVEISCQRQQVQRLTTDLETRINLGPNFGWT